MIGGKMLQMFIFIIFLQITISVRLFLVMQVRVMAACRESQVDTLEYAAAVSVW